jgi:RNA polymerase subunit RPABC4/transcription elongation factor Spt4
VGVGFWPMFLPWWGFGFAGLGLPHLCPKCGRLVPVGSRFCPYCGAPQPGAPPLGNPCPECQRPTVPGAPFCPYCATDMTRKVCKACQASISPRAKFCSECGAAVK